MSDEYVIDLHGVGEEAREMCLAIRDYIKPRGEDIGTIDRITIRHLGVEETIDRSKSSGGVFKAARALFTGLQGPFRFYPFAPRSLWAELGANLFDEKDERVKALRGPTDGPGGKGPCPSCDPRNRKPGGIIMTDDLGRCEECGRVFSTPIHSGRTFEVASDDKEIAAIAIMAELLDELPIEEALRAVRYLDERNEARRREEAQRAKEVST